LRKACSRPAMRSSIEIDRLPSTPANLSCVTYSAQRQYPKADSAAHYPSPFRTYGSHPQTPQPSRRGFHYTADSSGPGGLGIGRMLVMLGRGCGILRFRLRGLEFGRGGLRLERESEIRIPVIEEKRAEPTRWPPIILCPLPAIKLPVFPLPIQMTILQPLISISSRPRCGARHIHLELVDGFEDR
jgi:hypothetical protein